MLEEQKRFEPGERVSKPVMFKPVGWDSTPEERTVYGIVRSFDPDGQAYLVRWDYGHEMWERPESLSVVTW